MGNMGPAGRGSYLVAKVFSKFLQVLEILPVVPDESGEVLICTFHESHKELSRTAHIMMA
jgi:hypothetical protein